MLSTRYNALTYSTYFAMDHDQCVMLFGVQRVVSSFSPRLCPVFQTIVITELYLDARNLLCTSRRRNGPGRGALWRVRAGSRGSSLATVADLENRLFRLVRRNLMDRPVSGAASIVLPARSTKCTPPELTTNIRNLIETHVEGASASAPWSGSLFERADRAAVLRCSRIHRHHMNEARRQY